MKKNTKDAFRVYLLTCGYAENVTHGGVDEYVKRVDRVCAWERISWEELVLEIGGVLRRYEKGDRRFAANSFVRALKRFEEFVRKKGE